MYVLYWHPDSSSLAPMAVLEEIGAAYEAVRIDIVAGENFSPDYKKLYVADTGSTHYPEAPRNIKVWNVIAGTKLGSGRQFAVSLAAT